MLGGEDTKMKASQQTRPRSYPEEFAQAVAADRPNWLQLRAVVQLCTLCCQSAKLTLLRTRCSNDSADKDHRKPICIIS